MCVYINGMIELYQNNILYTVYYIIIFYPSSRSSSIYVYEVS